MIPRDGLGGLKQYWKTDLSAGFVVFLLALPLSVGIAIASGMPATSGILAAVVGGIIGSLLGGSYTTINGPAAGLIVIVLAAVTELGGGDLAAGFRPALGVIVVAGLIQVAMGVSRMGGLGLAFPTSVIHGMLMSIGVIIFAKQIHVGLGVTPGAKSIFGLLGEIPHSFSNMNPEIALIGVASLLIVVLLGQVKNPYLKKIPAPLVAVIFGVAMGMYFDIAHEHMVKSFMGDSTVGPKFLLNVPENIRDAIAFPDFKMISHPVFWKHAIAIALVGTIESVLSAYAVDKLDSYKRVSNLNRELWSKGICNTVGGAIGAVPVIAEIVRSSANVSNGAKTRWANFFHGCFLLLFVVLFPAMLHRIPLSSLAAILVVTGYRLGNPKQLGHAWEMGWDQALVMFGTLLMTLATDLLVGVAFGFVLETTMNVFRARSFTALFGLRWKAESRGATAKFTIEGPLVSTNFIRIRETLAACIGKKSVKVDLSHCSFVDHTVMEHLERLEADGRSARTPFTLVFSRRHVGISSHPLAGRKLAS